MLGCGILWGGFQLTFKSPYIVATEAEHCAVLE